MSRERKLQNFYTDKIVLSVKSEEENKPALRQTA